MKEPLLAEWEKLGAPLWFRRMYFPHVFRRDDFPPPFLKEDRQVRAGNLPTEKLKRRKPEDKPRRKRRVRVERTRLTPLEWVQFTMAEAQFAANAHKAHKLATMSDTVKAKKELAKEAREKGVK